MYSSIDIIILRNMDWKRNVQKWSYPFFGMLKSVTPTLSVVQWMSLLRSI